MLCQEGVKVLDDCLCTLLIWAGIFSCTPSRNGIEFLTALVADSFGEGLLQSYSSHPTKVNACFTLINQAIN